MSNKTHKAGRTEWREKVMNTLNLNYTIVNNKIIFKGNIGNYKTLVDLLVIEAEKLNIQVW